MSLNVESDVPQKLVEAWLRGESELGQFLDAFLRRELPLRDWTHRGHLGVAAALIQRHGRDGALAILRDAIAGYNEATGGANTSSGGYHETLTVFWVDRVADLLARLPGEWNTLSRVRAVVEAYGGMRRLDRAYYSFDVVNSQQARREWVPPDL